MVKRKEERFWRRKPVLITGVSGFVGRALSHRLVSLGARLIGLLKADESKRYFFQSGLDKQMRVLHGNLEDFSPIEQAIRRHHVEVVYHLGAQAIVTRANQNPLETFEANIEWTWSVLEACRGKKRMLGVVVASSDKAYGTHIKLPSEEIFPLQPEFPYDVSKACADLIAQSYYKTYQLPVVVTRFANIYGPGDFNFTRIVPDTLRSVMKGKRPIIRSDGTPERDYLYIDDVVDLYLLLVENIGKTKGQVFNAGNQKPIRVSDLVRMITHIAGRQDLEPLIKGKKSLHGEIDRQWLDASKIRKLLGWRPKVTFQNGLKRTCEWYRSYFEAR